MLLAHSGCIGRDGGWSLKTVPCSFTVRDREDLRVDIRIETRLTTRTVPVKVVWPDGKPVDEASVWLSEAARPDDVVGDSVSHTGPNGEFDLIGLEGIDYVVHADIYVKPSYTPHCADNALAPASNPPTERITLTLGKTGEMCRTDD
jgi:hypothetical protein